MLVELTQNSIAGEPGPNLYWAGEHHEFRSLLNDLHILGVATDRTVELTTLPYIRLEGLRSYRLISSTAGRTISRVVGTGVEMNMNVDCWRVVLHNILSISFSSGFVYQEFDGKDFVEDANVIMRSFAKPDDLIP